MQWIQGDKGQNCFLQAQASAWFPLQARSVPLTCVTNAVFKSVSDTMQEKLYNEGVTLYHRLVVKYINLKIFLFFL